MLAASLAAAVVLGMDAFYSAQEGYLARPPEYDGVGYLFYAQAPYHLIQGLHLRAALTHLITDIAPLWTSTITLHYLVLGDGVWEAFTTRLWPIALVLVLAYWIVRNRAPRMLAIAAAALTAVLPLVSAGVRSASWEYVSGQANYNDDWGLDDLRPDFLALALTMWSVALLAENAKAPRRSHYLASAGFMAAAVLAKPSTGPVALVAWTATLLVTWWWNRQAAETPQKTALAAGLAALLLLPWAVIGHGLATTLVYFREAAVTYKDAYSLKLSFLDALTYYLVRIPAQLGQVEAWPVILGSLFLIVTLWRGLLARAEWIYAGLVLLFYLAFTGTSNKNPHVGEWFTFALWIFFLAGASRFLVARWPAQTVHWSPRALAIVGGYILVVYAAGLYGLAGWPLNEQRANEQLVSVTDDVARELGRHVSPGQCFSYAPGPGWPASLEIQLESSAGVSPLSTPIDVDPSTSTDQYIAVARACPALVVYRDDIKQVAKAFFCPPVRQPYLQALSDWVRTPASGYRLVRSWQFHDLPPVDPHPLGRYQGISLTVDLYLRIAGA